MSRKGQQQNRQCPTVSLTLPKPYYDRGGIRLYHGDCLQILPLLEAESADALITDPPYCSGAATMNQRTLDPREKYCHNGNDCGRPSFSGDARDQRSFGFWATLWISECRRIVRPSGYALVFSDWRQLPTVTDVVQAGGWIWRGIISWNKGRGARAPHKGYFRHQCEYVTWGTNGACLKATHSGPFEGCVSEAVKQADKFHMTGKPTPLMCQLVDCVPPGGTVLDTFAGSSTTGVACLLTGRKFIGFEQSEEYCEISARRFDQILRGKKAA